MCCVRECCSSHSTSSCLWRETSAAAGTRRNPPSSSNARWESSKYVCIIIYTYMYYVCMCVYVHVHNVCLFVSYFMHQKAMACSKSNDNLHNYTYVRTCMREIKIMVLHLASKLKLLYKESCQ